MRCDVALACADMGEFELIGEITKKFTAQADVLLGPGDDAAQLRIDHGSVLASADILVEDVHFRRGWTTPFGLGRRAAAQNFADIVAMGANPRALLVSVAAPLATPESWFTELAEGLQAECDVVGASVIGGDLSTGPVITIAVTVLGDPSGGAPVTRAGARVGDIVAVAGRLGWSALGLAALERGVTVDPTLIDAYLVPTPPYAAGPAARAAGATAMLDVSDGLLADAGHIARASGVTIALDGALLLPDATVAEAAAALGLDPMATLLTGGEDHALLATFPAGNPPELHIPQPLFRVIGRVEGAGAYPVLVDGAPFVGPAGHDHFR